MSESRHDLTWIELMLTVLVFLALSACASLTGIKKRVGEMQVLARDCACEHDTATSTTP